MPFHAIMISMYNRERDHVLAIERGVDGIMTLPLKVEEFRAWVKQTRGGSRMRWILGFIVLPGRPADWSTRLPCRSKTQTSQAGRQSFGMAIAFPG